MYLCPSDFTEPQTPLWSVSLSFATKVGGSHPSRCSLILSTHLYLHEDISPGIVSEQEKYYLNLWSSIMLSLWPNVKELDKQSTRLSSHYPWDLEHF